MGVWLICGGRRILGGVSPRWTELQVPFRGPQSQAPPFCRLAGSALPSQHALVPCPSPTAVSSIVAFGVSLSTCGGIMSSGDSSTSTTSEGCSAGHSFIRRVEVDGNLSSVVGHMHALRFGDQESTPGDVSTGLPGHGFISSASMTPCSLRRPRATTSPEPTAMTTHLEPTTISRINIFSITSLSIHHQRAFIKRDADCNNRGITRSRSNSKSLEVAHGGLVKRIFPCVVRVCLEHVSPEPSERFFHGLGQ